MRFRGQAGWDELEAKLVEAIDDVDEAERSAREQAKAELRARDERLLDSLRERVAAELRARRFGEAVDEVGLERDAFRVTEVRGEYQAWVDRLRGAERALLRFLDAVATGKLTITLDVEFVRGRGPEAGKVIEVDRRRRALVLEGADKGVLAELAFDDPGFPSERLLTWCEQLGPTPLEQLDLACLCYELGYASRGRKLLLQLEPGKLGSAGTDRQKALLLLHQQELR